MTSPKTKEELVIENALLKQKDAIKDDFRAILKEALQPLMEAQEAQRKINQTVATKIGALEDRLDKIWLKVFSVSAVIGAVVTLIGYFVANAGGN